MSDFCSAPFNQIVLMPNGDVLPCCLREDYPLGSITNSSLKEIWDGPRAEKLRDEFRSGSPIICKNKMKTEQCYLAHSHDDKEVISNYLERPTVFKLDARLNGKCNLECVMCRVWKEPNGIYNENDIWHQLDGQLFSSLKEMSVLGGEPFIQKDTFRLIKKISESHPNCRWLFNTNAQWKFTPAIKHWLDQIEITMITISLDSLDEIRFERIRRKGSLERLKSTLATLTQYRDERAQNNRGFILRVAMAVQRANRFELLKFAEFAENLGLEFSFIFLEEPPHLSLHSLSPDEKYFYLEFLNKVESRLTHKKELKKLGRYLITPIVNPECNHSRLL